MLIEDVHKTDFFQHDLSEIPPSIEPALSELCPSSPKDKPIAERIILMGDSQATEEELEVFRPDS